jgi:uncharacterized protein YneF (UPF0154 family)
VILLICLIAFLAVGTLLSRWLLHDDNPPLSDDWRLPR